jgi:hypothetical protein
VNSTFARISETTSTSMAGVPTSSQSIKFRFLTVMTISLDVMTMATGD